MNQELKYDNPLRENLALIIETLDWTWEVKKYIQTSKYENLKVET